MVGQSAGIAMVGEEGVGTQAASAESATANTKTRRSMTANKQELDERHKIPS
jgi:hypothetical protein